MGILSKMASLQLQLIIAGNFFDLIKNKIDDIGNDPHEDGFIYGPSVKFSEMTIAGK